MILPLPNLRIRILLLVIAAVLPALGLLLYTAGQQRDQAIADAEENARRLASLAASNEGRLVDGTRQLLAALSHLPQVEQGGAACSALLKSLLSEYPVYANLGVIAPNGNLICSAVPTSGTINLADRPYFRDAVATKSFAVGAYSIGRVTGQPSVNVGYPIVAGNTVRAVVYAALSLTWLTQYAASADLPTGAVLTVLDRTGTVLVRVPPAPGWMGRSLLATPVIATIIARGSGVVEAPGEGTANGTAPTRQVYAYAALGGGATGPPTGYLTIAIPEDQVVAPAERAFNQNLTRLGLVVLVVLVAAWVGGDLLVGRDTEANKALVRRIYDAFDTGAVDGLDDVVAEDFIDRDPLPGQAPGLVGLKQAVGLFRAAFPDGELKVDQLIAEGDKVVAVVTLRGTPAGSFAGQSVPEEPMVARGIETFRVAGGKVVEAWSRFGPLRPEQPSLPAPAVEVGQRA